MLFVTPFATVKKNDVEKEKEGKGRRSNWSHGAARRIKFQRGNEPAVALKISTILSLHRLPLPPGNFIDEYDVSFPATV